MDELEQATRDVEEYAKNRFGKIFPELLEMGDRKSAKSKTISGEDTRQLAMIVAFRAKDGQSGRAIVGHAELLFLEAMIGSLINDILQRFQEARPRDPAIS